MQLASWRTIVWIIRRADIVLEVIDIRDPVSTRSKRLERIVENLGKKLVIVLNKSDLVPRYIAEKWKRILTERGYHAVYIAAKNHKGTRILRRTINLLRENNPTIVAVVGFPKTGKSTIINALKGRHSATTSPIPGSPGYTKHAQLYKIGENLYMLDTPGIIPIEGGRLEAVIRGYAPEELRNPIKPAIMLIEKVLKYNPHAIEEAYGIKELDPYRILEELARRRGWFYKKDKEPLVEEAARTIIRDYHEGKIKFFVPPPI